MFTLIELRLALTSYQDYPMLLLTPAGGKHPRELLTSSVGPAKALFASRSVLGSWVIPCGTRLGIRRGGKGAVRLPKILVLTVHAKPTPVSRLDLCGAHS